MLTFQQRMELLIGAWNREPHFASDRERRAAWKAHREDLLSRDAPGMRPWAFWQYEAPVELRYQTLEQAEREPDPRRMLIDDVIPDDWTQWHALRQARDDARLRWLFETKQLGEDEQEAMLAMGDKPGTPHRHEA